MSEFRDRIAEVLKQHQRTTGMAAAMGWTCQCGFYALGVSLQEQIVRHQTDALIAAGVVADPAEVERLQDLSADHSKAYGILMAENDRLRAALHDIAALHQPVMDTKPGGGVQVFCKECGDDWRCDTAAILARHGIDTEEPQP